jgi:hypothetical protein
MEPFSAFLLSMQAAGVVTSIWQNKGAQKQIQLGRALEKASLDANLAANNFEFQESSLASMQALRQNLGTQAVMQAARGNAAGTESAVGAQQKSISATSGDIEAKRMNMLSKESSLRAANILSGQHTLKSETELGRSMSKDIFEAASTGMKAFGISEAGMNLSKKFGFS